MNTDTDLKSLSIFHKTKYIIIGQKFYEKIKTIFNMNVYKFYLY